MNQMKNHDMKQQLLQLGNGAHVIAMQILGSPDDATDAVHDAYVKVTKRPGSCCTGDSHAPITPGTYGLKGGT